jgi:hypothetical protein
MQGGKIFYFINAWLLPKLPPNLWVLHVVQLTTTTLQHLMQGYYWSEMERM